MDADNEELEATKKMREKTADEMFKELGYKKEQYFEAFKKRAEFFNKEIIFDKVDEVVKINTYNKSTYSCGAILLSMQELQAINEKCKELRLDR